MDPASARVVAAIRIHGIKHGSPIDVTIGEAAVWTANDDGTVSRINPLTASVEKRIPLGRYPRVAYPVSLAAGEGAVWVAVH